MSELYLFDLILPMNGLAPIDKGYMLVEKGHIVNIGNQNELKLESLKNSNFQVHNFSDGIALPGFINNHVHLAYKRNYKQVKPGAQLNWMKELIFSSRNETAEDKLQTAKDNIESVLKSGTTFLVENTPFPQTVQALGHSPLKALVGLEVFGNDPARADDILKCSLNDLAQLEASYGSSKISFTLSPHAVYNVSGQLFINLTRWAQNNHKLLLTHLAEFSFESQLTHNGQPEPELKEFYAALKVHEPNLKFLKGLSPVAYLHKLGCLVPNLLLTHLINLKEPDFGLLAESGCKLVSCPRSNSYLLNGRCNIGKLHQKGLRVSFATDGLSSNFDFDLLDEIKAAQHISGSAGESIEAQTLFEAITSVPAKQLGLGEQIGSLQVGKKADFVCFKLDEHQQNAVTTNLANVYVYLLSELKTNMLAGIWIDGKAIKSTV
jgi:cytosine/adenosine deaminase-related metal-dependent hydrolase